MNKSSGWVLLFIGLFSLNLSAQADFVSKKNANKKQLKLLNKAKQEYRGLKNDTALKTLDELLKKEPMFIDAHLLKAVICQDDFSRNKVENIASLREAIQLDSFYNKNALFSLGESLIKSGEYQEGLNCMTSLKNQENFYSQYQQDIDTYIELSEFGIDRLKEAINLEISTITAINTEKPETFPSLTASGERLYFGRIVNRQEDIYSSYWSEDKWSKPERFTTIINSPTNESTQSLSSDGNTLVFSACQRNDSQGSCDLYICHKETGRWTIPVNMGPVINSASWESQPCLAEDGQVLYFASNRSGGIGGKDLYYSKKSTAGWTSPINLGPTINTNGDEGAPFVHYSNRELYFMSTGHPGFGQQDLFMARGQGQQSWDSVYHFPSPINSHLEEVSLIVDIKGEKAYFSKEKEHSTNNYRDMDLYSFDMPDAFRPTLSGYVKGIVLDEKGRIIPDAIISIYSLSSEYKKEIKSDDQGEFLLSVALVEEYGIVVKKEAFVMHSEEFGLNKENEYRKSAKQLVINLTGIKQLEYSSNQAFVLKNVFFETGKSQLDKRSLKELNLLKVFLEENPKLRIELQGHTDNVGNPEDNLSLSQERAIAVRSYLVELGIDASRLQAQGYGENNNIVPNDTPKNRSINRRTSFKPLVE